MSDKAMTKVGETLRGTLIGRDHPDYEDARKLYNGMIDKRPLMIARCADVADVITAVNFGRRVQGTPPWSMVIAGIDPNPQKAGALQGGARPIGKPCILRRP